MSIKECRICYEDETETELLFIQPCQCKGSSANVHAECLDKWRQTNCGRLPFIQCQECHTYYNIGYEYPIDKAIIRIDCWVTFFCFAKKSNPTYSIIFPNKY